jgi:hypothetical protein
MLENRKISKVVFAHPVWVDGLGMIDRLDVSPDVDTGRAKVEGVSMTWLAAERVLRVVTLAGETWLAVACSMKPVYELHAGVKGKK